MKKIAVDVSWLGPTGIGRVAKEVLSRSPPGFEVEAVREGRKNAGVFTPFDLSRYVKRSKANAFWSPGFIPPFFQSEMPVVITVHDLTHLHFYAAHHRLYYNTVIRPLLSKVDIIVTVSDYTRTELLTWSGINEKKVVRIYNGIGLEFNPLGRKWDIGVPYILYAGNRRSYKNVERLMRAFSVSKLKNQGLVLALTGEKDAICTKLEHELGLTGSVHYLGFIKDSDLPAVYRGAHALAFVSLYEGFGLPILEAMASGIPVLTSAVSSMPEVAGGAALLVDPTDIEDIASGLLKVARDTDARKLLVTNGLTRAAQFSWHNTAAGYWSAFDRLLSQN